MGFKILIGTLVLLVTILLSTTAVLGQKMHQRRMRGWVRYHKSDVDTHKSLAFIAPVLLVVVLTLLEFKIRMSFNPYTINIPLFVIHLIIDALMLGSFVAIWIRFSGIRSPQWHKYLAYAFLGLYTMSCATGLVLLYQMQA